MRPYKCPPSLFLLRTSDEPEYPQKGQLVFYFTFSTILLNFSNYISNKYVKSYRRSNDFEKSCFKLKNYIELEKVVTHISDMISKRKEKSIIISQLNSIIQAPAQKFNSQF